jgi:hypothetical protein
LFDDAIVRESLAEDGLGFGHSDKES